MSDNSGAGGRDPARGHPPDGDPGAKRRGPALFRSLWNRNYRLLWLGSSVANLGGYMQATAQDWLVLELTHGSGAAVGITVGLQVLPTLLLGLHGSVLADRYSKLRILMVTRVVLGTLALLLGVLTVTGAVRVWHVYMLALGYGLTMALAKPASVAFVSEVLGPDRVNNANGLGVATNHLTKMLGPAVAGVLIAVVGTGPVFLINAATFGVMLLAYRRVRVEELDAGTPVPRAKGQLREGLRHVREHRDLALLMTTVVLVSVFGMNYTVTNAVMSREVFHAEASSFGLVAAAMAAGGVAGALLTARWEWPGMRHLLALAAVFSALVAAGGLVPVYWAFLLVQVPTGAAMTMFMTTARTITQLSAPKEMRGRVVGLYLLAINGISAIGWPLAGWLSELHGPRTALIGGGLASLVSVGVIAFLRRRPR